MAVRRQGREVAVSSPCAFGDEEIYMGNVESIRERLMRNNLYFRILGFRLVMSGFFAEEINREKVMTCWKDAYALKSLSGRTSLHAMIH